MRHFQQFSTLWFCSTFSLSPASNLFFSPSCKEYNKTPKRLIASFQLSHSYWSKRTWARVWRFLFTTTLASWPYCCYTYELKNQYYFPTGTALLSCKFYHFPQLQFTMGDPKGLYRKLGKGLKEKVTQTHKLCVSSLKRPYLSLGCHLQDKIKWMHPLFNRKNSLGCAAALYDSVFFLPYLSQGGESIKRE